MLPMAGMTSVPASMALSFFWTIQRDLCRVTVEVSRLEYLITSDHDRFRLDLYHGLA